MEKKTNKKTISPKKVVAKKIKVSVKKTPIKAPVKLTRKASVEKKKVVARKITKTFVKKNAIRKSVVKKKGTIAAKKIQDINRVRSVIRIGKKTSFNKNGNINLKISSEFAIAVLLIVAGTFGYIFWKGGSEQIFVSNDSYKASFSAKESDKKIESDEPIEKWKLFRSENFRNEFRLPKNWKFLKDDDKFVAEDSAEEISIETQENSENYTADDLLEIAQKEDEKSNVKLLSDQEGIQIEKREDDMLKQTAKILLGDNIVTVAYSTYGADKSELFFKKIVPTFKSL